MRCNNYSIPYAKLFFIGFLIGFIVLFFLSQLFNIGAPYGLLMLSFFLGAGAISCFFIAFYPNIKKIRYKKALFNKYIAASEKALFLSNAQSEILFYNDKYQKIFPDNKRSIFELLGRDQMHAAKLYRLKLSALKNEKAAEDFTVIKDSQDFSSLAAQPNQSVKYIRISVTPLDQMQTIAIWIIEDVTHFYDKDAYACFITSLGELPFPFFRLYFPEKKIFYNEKFQQLLNITSSSQRQEIDLEKILSDKQIKCIYEALKQNKEIIPAFQIEDDNDNNCSYEGDLYLCKKEQLEQNYIDCAFFPIKERKLQKPIALSYNLEELPVAAALLEMDGRFSQFNKIFEKLFLKNGFSLKEEKYSSLVYFLEKTEQESIKERMQFLVEKKQGFLNFDVAIDNEKNQFLCFYLSKLSKGNHLFLIVMESIGQKALEAQIEQNQKMQAVGQLAGGIAHDFNNVLTAIIISCDLLLNNHRISDPSHPDLINIKNNANRAAALVQQLLAFSRQQTLKIEKIYLGDLLSDLHMMLLRLIGSNIKLTILQDTEKTYVKIDSASMQRVIVNLVLNAKDAVPQIDGEIVIKIATINVEPYNFAYHDIEPGKYVQFTVEDNGCGIEEHIKEKIFEPFFTTKGVGKGTGLGLSTVYGVIKQMGGAVYCETSVGQGTSFHIFLPACEEESIIESDKEKKLAQSVKLSESTDLSGDAIILIVEDEDAVRMGNVRALKSRGYKVLEACSGIEALEVLEAEAGKIDLIISDVVMPEMDGPTLWQKVCTLYPEVKFIFISGYAEAAFAKGLPKDAKYSFLAKPFSLKKLASIVKDVLAKDIKINQG